MTNAGTCGTAEPRPAGSHGRDEVAPAPAEAAVREMGTGGETR